MSMELAKLVRPPKIWATVSAGRRMAMVENGVRVVDVIPMSTPPVQLRQELRQSNHEEFALRRVGTWSLRNPMSLAHITLATRDVPASLTFFARDTGLVPDRSSGKYWPARLAGDRAGARIA